MGGQNGKHRRNNGLRPESNASLYGLCMGQPSQVFYSKSLENCSLKLYRTENSNGNSANPQDEVVVLLDCGGRVYANGKRVYPFDGTPGTFGCSSTPAVDIPAEFPSVRWSGEIARIPENSYKIVGGDDRHVQPGDYAGALNTLLSLVADTFEQLLKDGLKMQENIRVLEEENTALSLKVLELKREQLHTQKLELEKKKLELRVEELETKQSLAGPMYPQRRKINPLMRTGSLGHNEIRARTMELEAVASQGRVTNGINGVHAVNGEHNENESIKMRPRTSAMTRIKQIESERDELNKESAVLQFQLDRLASEHQSTKTTIQYTSSPRRSPPLSQQLSNGSTSNHLGSCNSSYLGSSSSLKHRALTQCQENGTRAHSSMEQLNISFEGGNSDRYEKLDGTWERYDTLKRRYEDLKLRRLQRMNRYASQDDVIVGNQSPRTPRRTPLPLAPGSSATINGYLSASNGSSDNRRGSSDNSSENGYSSP